MNTPEDRSTERSKPDDRPEQDGPTQNRDSRNPRQGRSAPNRGNDRRDNSRRDNDHRGSNERRFGTASDRQGPRATQSGRPYESRENRPTYGNSTPRPEKREGDREQRRNYGDRGASYGKRDARSPYSGQDRHFAGDEGRAGSTDGDRDRRPSYGDRDGRPSYGDRDNSRRSSGGERDSRSSYGDRRPSYGDRQRSADSRPRSRDSAPRGRYADSDRAEQRGSGRQERSERTSRPYGQRQGQNPGRARPEQDSRPAGPRTPRAADREATRNAPAIPEDVQFSDLSKEARAPLRTLSKDNAETVGRHLAMVVQLIDVNPELAYEHAQAAVRSAGRVDVVREAAGLCAYRTGRYAEALRELRTVRRLNGSSEHLPVMADCERGLDRPERAIALAASPEAETLDPEAAVELAIVVSGARMDLGEPEAAHATLDALDLSRVGQLQRLRVLQAKARLLEATGRKEEADALVKDIDPKHLRAAVGGEEPDEEVIVYDLFDLPQESDDEDQPAQEAPFDGTREEEDRT